MGGQAQSAALAIAAGRIVVGASLCAAPSLAAHWAGKDARGPGVGMIVRALGARDAALGVGTLASARDPAQLRRWLLASSACDAADFAATLAGPRSPARTFVLASAAAATVAGLAAAGAV
jgi:hypothetical protein